MKQLTTLLLALPFTANLNAQPPAYIPTSGLIAWYPFNGNALDESGNGHDLTVNGSTLTSDRNGMADKAYTFSGSGAHMNGGSDPAFEILGDRTISVWIRSGAILNDDQGIVGYIGSSGALAGHAGYYLKRRFVDPDVIGAYEDSAQVGMGNYGAAWSDGPCGQAQWHHLVHHRSGGITSLWVDGVLQASTYALVPYFQNSELLVGWSGSVGQYFHGEIDDIGFWDRALSPAEIAQVYAAGGSGACLIAAYAFDGSAVDTTGNGHDGTVYGAMPATDRFGNLNSCYQFDGVDDWIRLAGSFGSSAGTVTAWINMDDMTNPNPAFVGRDTTMNGIGIELGIDPNTGPDASRLSYGFDHRDCVGGGCNVFFEIGDPQLTQNNWHHIAMSSDGSQARLFIDCLPITSYDGSCGDGGGLWFDALCQDVTYMIGRHKRPLSEHFFAGRIDDVRIYNCALDSSDIAAMCDFNSSAASIEPPTSAHLYPNPTTGMVRIDGLSDGALVQVFDATGRLLHARSALGSSPMQLDLSALTPGTYIVRAGLQKWALVRE